MAGWTGETGRGRLTDEDIKILSPEDITLTELAEKTGGIPEKSRETGDELIDYPQYGAALSIEGSFYQSPKRTAYRIRTSDELGEDTLAMPFKNTLVVFQGEDTGVAFVSHQGDGRFHLFTISKDNGYSIDKYKPLNAMPDEATMQASAICLARTNLVCVRGGEGMVVEQDKRFERVADFKTAGNVAEDVIKEEVKEEVRYIPAREIDFTEVAARTDAWVKFDREGNPYSLMYEHGKTGRMEILRYVTKWGAEKRVQIALLENGRSIKNIENTVAIMKKDSVTFVDPLPKDVVSDKGLQGVKIDSRRNVSHFWVDSPCLDKEIQRAAYLAYQEKSRTESKAGSEKAVPYLTSH